VVSDETNPHPFAADLPTSVAGVRQEALAIPTSAAASEKTVKEIYGLDFAMRSKGRLLQTKTRLWRRKQSGPKLVHSISGSVRPAPSYLGAAQLLFAARIIQ